MTDLDFQQRLINWYTIEEQTWSSYEQAAPGIYVYHDVLPKEMNISERLEKEISNNAQFSWAEATVGYRQKMPEYRDCFDFKYKTLNTQTAHDEMSALYNETYYRQLQAVKHYSTIFNISELRYWEATNFVKYGPGQHFEEHHDHGFSYNCTVSLVAYPNDNYEGGEINFRLQNLTVKPRAGDLFVFPSNYMYPHKSLPVVSGTKYALVTMLDYSDKYHKPEFFTETGT